MYTKWLWHRPVHDRRFAVLLAVCTVLAVVLLVCSSLQGPRVRRAEFYTRDHVTGLPQVQLRLNQPVKTIQPTQIDSQPTATVLVTTSDDLVTIQLVSPLEPGMTYRLTINDIQSKYGRQTSTVHHQFKVPITLLVRPN